MKEYIHVFTILINNSHSPFLTISLHSFPFDMTEVKIQGMVTSTSTHEGLITTGIALIVINQIKYKK